MQPQKRHYRFTRSRPGESLRPLRAHTVTSASRSRRTNPKLHPAFGYWTGSFGRLTRLTNRGVLRAWPAGKGLRKVAEQAGVDRKTEVALLFWLLILVHWIRQGVDNVTAEQVPGGVSGAWGVQL